MTLEETLIYSNVQVQIDKAAKKYRNKKILIYGTGLLSQKIFQNYDLSLLNIVGIVNIKYGSISNDNFADSRCVELKDVLNKSFDVVLVANEDFRFFRNQLQNYLFKNNYQKRVKIKPLIVLKEKPLFIMDKIFELLYLFSVSEKLVNNVANFLAMVNSFWIFDLRKRENKRKQLAKKYCTKIYGFQVLQFAETVGKNFWCGGFSNVTRNTVLGNNVHFSGMNIQGKGLVKIGSYFHSGKNCMIISDNHNYDFGASIPYDNKILEKSVEISDFVWIGANVLLLPGTKIGEGVIIQGGSVVHGEIPPLAIVGGNPAKVFKFRNAEHFNNLKQAGKFY